MQTKQEDDVKTISIPPLSTQHPAIVTQDAEHVSAACAYAPHPLNRVRNGHPVEPTHIVHVEHGADQPWRIHGTAGVLVEKRGCWTSCYAAAAAV